MSQWFSLSIADDIGIDELGIRPANPDVLAQMTPFAMGNRTAGEDY